ncbi:MAG: hypothetical protein ABSG70_15710 [Terriglobales bacterium]
MLMNNYTYTDILGTLEAAALLAIFLLPPGFLLGYVSNAAGFRAHSAAERFLWSVVLSVSISPILAVLLVRFCSLTVAVTLFLLAAAVAIILVGWEILAEHDNNWIPRRSTRVAMCIMAVWVVLALFSLVDWQIGDRLYVSYLAYDHSVRTVLVDAAARTGVPPKNPYFGFGGAPVLRYYYYWYVVCALPVHLAGISPRASLNGSVLWSGFALAALIPLYLKHFSKEREGLRFKSAVGIGLLLVTGYDLIPFLLLSRWLHALWGDMEWWDTNQVTSWIGSFLWVPHHVASLIACLTGFLLLNTLASNAKARERIWTALLAGAAFSSAAGLSVYVTFVFCVFASVWVVVVLIRKGPQEFFTYLGAGACALLLALPYLQDLQGPSTAGSKFVFFAFRDYPVAQLWLRREGLNSVGLISLSKLPTLFLVYFLEFGVYFLVAWWCLRREIRSHWKISFQQRAAWVMFAVSLLVVSVLASNTTGNNDLGSRGILVVQFVLLIWAAPLISEVFLPEGRSRLGRVWTITLSFSLLLGVLGTLLQLGLLRVYAPAVDAGLSIQTEPWIGRAPGFGKRTLLLRRSLDELKANITRTAVVQYNPATADSNVFHLYTDHQVAAGDDGCGATFGGELEKCKQVYPYIDAAFNKPQISDTWNMDQFCDQLNINVLVATDTDPAWRDSQSWVWTRPTLFSDDIMRAVGCGSWQQGR